jgi:hypothetical protein
MAFLQSLILGSMFATIMALHEQANLVQRSCAITADTCIVAKPRLILAPSSYRLDKGWINIIRAKEWRSDGVR